MLTPPLPSNNSAYLSLANSKHFAQLCLCESTLGIEVSNLKDGFFTQFTHSILNAALLRCSVLGVSIPHIILICPQKKMFRITTVAYITFMTNAHSFWNWAVLQLPRISMRLDLSPFSFGCFYSKSGTVTLTIDGSSPQPAPTRSICV